MEKNEMINKTIFDFNPTKEEIKHYACSMSYERYISVFNLNDRLADILDMLYARKDERYKEYLALVDDETRNDFNRLILHT